MKTLTEIQKQIANLLEISQDKYKQLIFETGLSYLDNYLEGSDSLIHDFSCHAGFWSWWKMQYRLVDEAFLHKFKHSTLNKGKLTQYYIHIHLAIDKHIDKVVWHMVERRRDEMINELIKKEVKNAH